MRIRILLLGLLLFGIPKLVRAQQDFVVGPLTAQAAACPVSPGQVSQSTSALTLATVNYGGATFTIGASAFSGTVSFFGSGDGAVTWQPLNVFPSNSTTPVTTATAAGVWQVNVAAYTNVCMVATTYSSGTITATIRKATVSARAGGGGGGGAGVASLNALTGAVTLAAGTNISLTPAGNTITVADTSISGLTTGSLTKAGSATTVVNSLCDEGITTANTLTCTDTSGIAAPGFVGTGTGAGFDALVQGADNCVAKQPAGSVCWEAPASGVTSYHGLYAVAPSTGIPHYSFTSPTITETISAIVGADCPTCIISAGAITNNVLPKGNGAQGLVNSSITDNATNVTTTDTGGYVAPVFTANGATAGFMDFAQGTTSGAVAPCNTANSICFQAPTAVTSYLINLAGAASTGIPHYVNAANVITETITPIVIGDLPTTGTWTFGGTLSGNISLTGADTFTDCPQIAYATCVDGITYAKTNAGIQAAVNATPSGGTVWLPAGTYALTATTAQQILVTQPINFMCAGWGSNLQLQTGAGSIPLLRIAPSGASGYVAYGIRVQDCQFSTATGGLGTYAIQVDTATTGSIGKLAIEHIYAGCTSTGTYYCQGGTNFGTGSIFFNNPTGTGGYYQSSIAHSKLYGGIKMTRAGDSITVSDNEIIPNAAADIFYVDSYPGSTLFRFQNNFMRMPFRTATDTTASSALQSPIFDGNVWEPESLANLGFSVTETNNALLDLDGSATSNVTYASITKNSFQPNANSYTLNAVRLNYATQTNIGGKGYINFFGITTTGCGATTCHALITTANSTLGNLFNHNIYSIATWTGSAGSIMDDVAGNTLITDDWVGGPGTQLVSQGSAGGANYYGATGIAMEAYTGETCLSDGNGGSTLGQCTSATPNATAIPSGTTFGFMALQEQTARPTATGADVCYGDSTAHTMKCSLNNGAFNFLPTVTASDTTTTHVLHATATGNVFTSSAIAAGDLPAKINGSCAPVASAVAVTSSNPTINVDQNLIQLSIPAGCLNTLSQPFEINGGGIYSSTAASSPVLTFRIKLCTISGCGSGTVVTLGSWITPALNTTAITNATYNIATTAVTSAIGTTGTMALKGNLTLDTGALVSTPDVVIADSNITVSGTIDLTAALFIDFTIAQSVAGASNSYTQMLGAER